MVNDIVDDCLSNEWSHEENSSAPARSEEQSYISEIDISSEKSKECILYHRFEESELISREFRNDKGDDGVG